MVSDLGISDWESKDWGSWYIIGDCYQINIHWTEMFAERSSSGLRQIREKTFDIWYFPVVSSQVSVCCRCWGVTSVLVLAMLVFPWPAPTSTPVDQWDQYHHAGLSRAVGGEDHPPGHPGPPALAQSGRHVCSTSEKWAGQWPQLALSVPSYKHSVKPGLWGSGWDLFLTTTSQTTTSPMEPPVTVLFPLLDPGGFLSASSPLTNSNKPHRIRLQGRLSVHSGASSPGAGRDKWGDGEEPGGSVECSHDGGLSPSVSLPKV